MAEQAIICGLAEMESVLVVVVVAVDLVDLVAVAVVVIYTVVVVVVEVIQVVVAELILLMVVAVVLLTVEQINKIQPVFKLEMDSSKLTGQIIHYVLAQKLILILILIVQVCLRNGHIPITLIIQLHLLFLPTV